MPQRTHLLLGAAAALALLVGCDGTSDLIEQPQGQPQSVVSEADGVRLTLQTDKLEYELGEPVAMTFEVKNTSDARRTFEFSDACQYDFLVHQGGGLVWSVGHDRMCAQALTSLDLGPGETWTRSDAWDQRSNKDEPVGPGTYDVTASLMRMGTPLDSDTLKIVIR